MNENTQPEPIQAIPFFCREKIHGIHQEWGGYIRRVHNHGSHYEIRVDSRSGFVFIVGNYHGGVFISIPAFRIGCDLASYTDYGWNTEALSKLMNPVDAATVAEALRTLNRNRLI